jgi:hypothetical protein
MFGFSPGWFLGAAISVVGLTETLFPERVRPMVRKVAFPLSAILFVISMFGFGVEFHEQYKLRWPIVSRVGSSSVQTSDAQWSPLTDDQKAIISLGMDTGTAYRIHIGTCQLRDCIELGDSFYQFFDGLHFNPEKPVDDMNSYPGILVGSVVGQKEKSGARLLVEALRKAGFPAVYRATGGIEGDTTIYLSIGMKPH